MEVTLALRCPKGDVPLYVVSLTVLQQILLPLHDFETLSQQFLPLLRLLSHRHLWQYYRISFSYSTNFTFSFSTIIVGFSGSPTHCLSIWSPGCRLREESIVILIASRSKLKHDLRLNCDCSKLSHRKPSWITSRILGPENYCDVKPPSFLGSVFPRFDAVQSHCSTNLDHNALQDKLIYSAIPS